MPCAVVCGGGRDALDIVTPLSKKMARTCLVVAPWQIRTCSDAGSTSPLKGMVTHDTSRAGQSGAAPNVRPR